MAGFEILLKGFAEFRRENYGSGDALMPRLAQDGQNPDYFIISCIDSRSHPGTIFRAKPGTFFGHKAMGAIVRPWQRGTALSAALQFSIKYNKVEKIIILGHTGCGAIKALVENLDDEEISSFIAVARTGLEKAKSCCGNPHPGPELLRRTEEQIVLQSTENLKTYPIVRKALKEGRIEIASWIFNMEEGAIYSFNSEKRIFTPLELP
jgi:carbonic anhydrase